MLIDITDTVQLTHTAAEVDADIDGSVRGDIAQTKDDDWKAQARDNIGAGTGSGGGGGRNLLMNPFFTINQRGQTSYSLTSGNTYCVDRWSRNSGSGVVNVTDDGITLVNSLSGRFHIKQVIDVPLSILADKTFTVSILNENGVVSHTFYFPSNPSTDIVSNVDIGEFNIYVQIDSASGLCKLLVGIPQGSANIRAIKFEEGSASTLANDFAPNYAEELAKCRYDCLVISANGGGVYFPVNYGMAFSEAVIRLFIPNTMRESPTIEASGAFQLINVGEPTRDVTSITNDSKNSYGVSLAINSSGLTLGNMYQLRAKNDANAKIIMHTSLG